MSKQDARRSLKLECLRDSVAEVQRLHELGYAKAGNWDLSQICQHLTKTLKMSIEGAPFNLPFFLKPVARWMLFDTVMAGKPTRLPLKTVPQFLPNDSADNMQDIADYESFVNKVMDDGVDLIATHPIFGPITSSEWRSFHAWHAAHHLSFLLPKTSEVEALSAR